MISKRRQRAERKKASGLKKGGEGSKGKSQRAEARGETNRAYREGSITKGVKEREERLELEEGGNRGKGKVLLQQKGEKDKERKRGGEAKKQKR